MGMREENALLREETGAARRELLGAQREKSLLESELGKRGDRVVQLQHELSQSAIAREGYRNQLEREGGELSRKNHELMMRIQELDSLHKRYEDNIRTSREPSPIPAVRTSTTRITSLRSSAVIREQRHL
eukprot:TRINITY_DN1042_c0_g1_i6.p1 TRINITY_DN1042_c0_g1~~TRINITY_DN1042_c0_g1_i6.p1  ORF type:complete len:141 (-),score=36.36 TRINITY_DN1042_c0_g1_i6:172-561(-)